MRYFEELSVGVKATFRDEYKVTEEEIIEVGKRWDPQPFHTDPVAAKDSIFGGLVASSAHIFSIYVRIGNTEIDEDIHVAAVTALGFDKLQWHTPVRPGDTLKNTYKVIKSRESKSRPDLGIVTMDCRVFNQNDETVFTLECTFLVKKRG
jgi:acyl dehydratase